MNGARALEVLGGFGSEQLAFTAEEIEELLKLQLVLEADPDDFAQLRSLDQIAREHELVTPIDDLATITALKTQLAELDGKLKSDWYRFTTRDEKLAAMETARRALRRAVAVLDDKLALARIVKIRDEARAQLPPGGAKYLACSALGDELYALTGKGARVYQQLALRIDRYKDYPLAAFMKAYDKTEAKMTQFSGDIAQLAGNIGYVKKNPHQIVIGLAKTGVPPAQAIDTYRRSVGMAGAADVAVTYTRNAAAHGGTMQVAGKLQQAQQALYQAGFPRGPVVDGAAKSLLSFEPLSAGVHRFVSIATELERNQHAFTSRGDLTIKLTARLMPADGAPADVVRRSTLAFAALQQVPGRVAPRNETSAAVALASMVRTDDAVMPLVQRYREVEAELVRRGISMPDVSDSHALECVGCPGTPIEVAETVRTLTHELAAQQRRDPQRADVAIAAAFAKRFAY